MSDLERVIQRREFEAEAQLADHPRHKLTIFDAMVLVAATAIGNWGAVVYRVFPLPIVQSGSWLLPLLWSIPVVAALTVGFLLVPVRTLRGRVRRVFRQPGTALCAAAVTTLLAVLVRWGLRAWFKPYLDGSLWIYVGQIIYEWARTCGLGIMAAIALLILGGRLRRQLGWIEWMRLALGAYWLAVFLIFSVL
jgi:hypothetical protein